MDYALLYVIDELIPAESDDDIVRLDDVWERYLEYAEKYNKQLCGSYRDKGTFGICLRNKLEKQRVCINFVTN